MAIRLWEYRKTTELEGSLVAHCWSDGIFQILCTDDSGNLLLHIIEEIDHQPDLDQYLGSAKPQSIHNMLLEESFNLVPKGFKNSMFPGQADELQVQGLSDNLFLTYNGQANCFHALFPLFQISASMAQNKEYFMYCWVHNKHCSILFFRSGNLEMANNFSVSGESEVLYYCMATLKKASVDVRKVKFEILGEQSESIIKAFQRFVPNVGIARMELPYNAGEYPPYSAVSFLLYHYLTCELRAVI